MKVTFNAPDETEQAINESNCTILIERIEGKEITHTAFRTDDYRVAIAIENLLHNMECCKGEVRKYKKGEVK